MPGSTATVPVWKHPPSAQPSPGTLRPVSCRPSKFLSRIWRHQRRRSQIECGRGAPVRRGSREARAIDDCRRRGEPLGPLAGVPITVKECFQLTGTPTTLGVRRRGESHETVPLATTDGPLIARLRSAGAIVVGKTNVPQLMLLYETDNPVYGRTNNPWDMGRGSGGSSGGEAAIIAAGGVPLGLATDLGGSIRQPAHVCGIHGLKPSGGRLTCVGSSSAFTGFDAMPIQPGPMARHVEDLALACAF